MSGVSMESRAHWRSFWRGNLRFWCQFSRKSCLKIKYLVGVRASECSAGWVGCVASNKGTAGFRMEKYECALQNNMIEEVTVRCKTEFEKAGARSQLKLYVLIVISAPPPLPAGRRSIPRTPAGRGVRLQAHSKFHFERHTQFF